MLQLRARAAFGPCSGRAEASAEALTLMLGADSVIFPNLKQVLGNFHEVLINDLVKLCVSACVVLRCFYVF